MLSSKASGMEGKYSKRWTRRPITTKTEGNKTTQSIKPSQINEESFYSKISTSTTINVNKTEIKEIQGTQYFDIRKKIAEDKEFANLITLIVFDIETTGFSRELDMIIEIALLDLQGGKNSMFQTLVNPDRYVPNAHVHGISTHMVCRPDVPRMEELIPIFKQYVKSREKPGGFVVFVAHKARSFDVPFLVKEFSRCSEEIPPNWRFLDTLLLAREKEKSGGSKLTSGLSLQALRKLYGIPLAGSAHRAMSDVKVLSLILQRLTFDLKLSTSDLVQKTFAVSDLNSSKKKKSSR
ncbi:exonuclease DPD1, chloroplastic/mitochondrial [Pistacia vera]|uniref:exonuclease DPD1, chloroplastic/mitochondrial n=1 Tax=Pistacia vera TaxID=55513 RepID=UPI001263B6CD|nr:exonuclease DPD1, chloroplastic/mitochondrial [Pistacia vera]